MLKGHGAKNNNTRVVRTSGRLVIAVKRRDLPFGAALPFTQGTWTLGSAEGPGAIFYPVVAPARPTPKRSRPRLPGGKDGPKNDHKGQFWH